MQKEEAFYEMIKNHEGLIYKITWVYCDTHDDRMDLYQDIVYQLWKGFDSFRGNSKRSTWMYRVALNTAYSFLRKQKKRGSKVGIDHLHLSYEIIDNLLEERLEKMYAQIKKLKDIDRAVILLLLEGKKYEEIATVTGFTRSNVATRISRIKEKLRNQLTKN
jgi:RNA polymerase sigma-70 factor (ECF subfamily)